MLFDYSLAIAIVVSYFALHQIARATLSFRRLAVGGVLMGFGIAGMHYTGMAAMRMQPGIRYHLPLLAASVATAMNGPQVPAASVVDRLQAPALTLVVPIRFAGATVPL